MNDCTRVSWEQTGFCLHYIIKTFVRCPLKQLHIKQCHHQPSVFIYLLPWEYSLDWMFPFCKVSCNNAYYTLKHDYVKLSAERKSYLLLYSVTYPSVSAKRSISSIVCSLRRFPFRWYTSLTICCVADMSVSTTRQRNTYNLYAPLEAGACTN